MSTNPIQLAYKAHSYVPVEQHRLGKRKKSRNPVVTTPALAKAMQHLGQNKLSLNAARQKAEQAIKEPDAAKYVRQLDWDELKTFLGAVSLFLKAGGKLKRDGKKAMRGFTEREAGETNRYTAEESVQAALSIAEKLSGSPEPANRNKLQSLSAQIATTDNKWDALACLARYYPLKGVPGPAIDEMVALLEQADLYTFKRVVPQAIMFFEASKKGWEGLQS